MKKYIIPILAALLASSTASATVRSVYADINGGPPNAFDFEEDAFYAPGGADAYVYTYASPNGGALASVLNTSTSLELRILNIGQFTQQSSATFATGGDYYILAVAQLDENGFGDATAYAELEW